jgi:hypothetical protein
LQASEKESGIMQNCSDLPSASDGRVTPADLGATVFRHPGIDLAAQWTDPQGRPQSIVTNGGRPIAG